MASHWPFRGRDVHYGVKPLKFIKNLFSNFVTTRAIEYSLRSVEGKKCQKAYEAFHMTRCLTTCANSQESNRPAHSRRPVGVFPISFIPLYVYCSSKEITPTDCADAQSDKSHHCLTVLLVCFSCRDSHGT